MGLFSEIERKNADAHRPLADRMRPLTIDEFVGQEDFLGEGKLLRRMLAAKRLTSIILYGPPGTGKTTLARLIADHVQAKFTSINAADAGIKDVRAVIEEAKDRSRAEGLPSVLFLDEIHHFNRNQQDILLPHVENGTIILVGATTQNPFFAINAPLVSRSQIFQFQSHTPEHIKLLLRRAIEDPERGFGLLKLDVREEALNHWATLCDGDARRALTALEIAVLSLQDEARSPGQRLLIERQVAEDSIQRKAVVYDRTGDEHYDVTSAFIKSMRGSDPDAAIYWLARMLEAGEDPRFILRRLVIFASEDIGCADPTSLLVATAAVQAFELVGLPEAQLNLAHAVVHLASAPKSGACSQAIWNARSDVKNNRTQPVPKHLRDSHYTGAKRLDQGQGYQSPHQFAEGELEQTYLGIDAKYYIPTDHGHEKSVAEHLEKFRRKTDNG